jgi:hypothetical protein
MLDIGGDRDGDPDFILLWEIEIASGHADDGVRLFIENESPTENRGIGSETGAPKPV